MENKNINPHLIRTDAKRSVKMKTKSKKSMNASFKNMAVALIIMSAPIAVQAKQWSLQDCISYALANNIQLQTTHKSFSSGGLSAIKVCASAIALCQHQSKCKLYALGF